jgi:hypothetical protein
MHIAIVTPALNEWTSLSHLIDELDAVEMPARVQVSLFVIDDGSVEPMEIDHSTRKLHRIREIEVVRLACNVGHQRAIAIGLVEVFGREGFDAVLVMDSDGEDRPSDIPRLIVESVLHPGNIICAKRERRPGLAAFRAWYECYKFAFRVLTGSQLDFGNFCLIPIDKLGALVSNSSIWNHLAATLTRSRLPIIRIPSDRGKRYAGKSKMNLVALVLHGLSAMAVYSDVILVRLLLGALGLSVGTLLGLMGVVIVRYFTDLAIPGWATSTAGILIVILLQALIMSTISIFVLLSTRNIKVVIPRADAENFVLSREKLFPILAKIA